MKRPLPTFLLLAVLLAQIPVSRVFSQTEAKSRPQAESRLDVKPKAHSTAAPSAKSGFFSFFRKSSKQDINPKRSLSINQYYRNLIASQSTRPTTKSTPAEPVAPPTSVSVERGEEQQVVNDKLFSNDRLTVSNLYPNPADASTTVDYAMSGSGNQAKLAFFNALGNPVGDYEFDRNERRMNIVTEKWPNGVYFYQLSLDGRTLATKKLLVRHQ